MPTSHRPSRRREDSNGAAVVLKPFKHDSLEPLVISTFSLTFWLDFRLFNNINVHSHIRSVLCIEIWHK